MFVYVLVIKRIWAFIFSKIDTYISGAIQQSLAKWVFVLYMYDYLSPQILHSQTHMYIQSYMHMFYSAM